MKDNQESDPSYQPLSPSSDSDEQEISMSSYINHQKFYLYPAIGHVWHNYQNDYANDIQQQQRYVTLGGDGRADTPGHSAKFGSYTMLDLDEGVFVDIQLLQRNEVKSSCDMEKEELQRSLEFCKDHNIKIKTLVTDRHVQINKRLKTWHVPRGHVEAVLRHCLFIESIDSTIAHCDDNKFTINTIGGRIRKTRNSHLSVTDSQ
ncbi:Hypothetical predicted protein, partial [Mytilus galloprovincialis]